MTAALIIAAGQTEGKARFEPEKKIGTITALKRIVMVFQQAGVRRIAVVCDDDRAEKLVPHMNLEFLRSPAGGEMLAGVKAGLAYLQDKCDAVLIAHTDVPLFSVSTVRHLLEADGEVCVPCCQGRGGHPLLLRAEQFSTILSYTGQQGLAGAIRSAGLHRQLVEVEDEGILANIQRSEEDYLRLVDRHDLAALRPAFRFQLMREQVFYGPGAHQLLHLTEETSSLLDACRRMGISYSKGRKIIANLEEQLGAQVIASSRGGRTGGASVVTEPGRRLMQSYDAFCGEAAACLEELFRKYFPGGGSGPIC